MKKLILLFYFSVFAFQYSFSQGVWTWIKGNDTLYHSAVYGTKGVSNAANNPAGLYGPCAWTDLQGNFWLFGGVTPGNDVNNDLWEYSTVTNEWTWMKGSGVIGDPGKKGTMGVPDTSSLPPARGWGVPTWVDLNGDLWMYAGGGNATNDLWRYNIATNTWTWMQGNGGYTTLPTYGIKGIPSANNTPGARSEVTATWVDSLGNLWLFGGYCYNGNTFQDLWMYDMATNEWAWMSGSNGTGSGGGYGTYRVPSTANCPTSRQAYCSWKDLNGKFWLFGGGVFGYTRNDMWEYNPGNNEWAWMSGANTGEAFGNYGPLCSTLATNSPSPRFENRASWISDCGKLWMYGGMAVEGNPRNDLWSFDPLTLQWTFINGSNNLNVYPVHGTMDVAASTNQPGGRGGTVSWKGKDGALYIYGGVIDGNNFNVFYNDLWKFQPDANCPSVSLNLGNDTAYCGPFSRVLSTGNTATVWSTGATAPQITVSTPGKYWATVTGGCGSVSDTITISGSSGTNAGVVNASPDSVCSGSAASLTVSGASGEIQWQSSLNGILFSDISADTTASLTTSALTQNTFYRVKASGACGTDSSAIKLISIRLVPIAGTITSSRDTICDGSGLKSTLNVTGGTGNTQWQTSIDGTHFSDLAGGTSSTYITPPDLSQTTYYRNFANSGCGADSSNIDTVHILPAPSVRFTYSIIGGQFSFRGDSVSTNVISYHWDFGDGETSNEINPVHAFDSIKTYYVCLTVYNGSNCSYTYCEYISLLSTGVENISSAYFIRLFPNPANDELTIEVLNSEAPKQITITDDLGRTLIQLNTDKIKTQIDVGLLAAGIYFVKTQMGDGGVEVNKFVKE